MSQTTAQVSDQPVCLCAGIDSFLGVRVAKNLQQKKLRLLAWPVDTNSDSQLQIEISSPASPLPAPTESVVYVLDTTLLSPLGVKATSLRTAALKQALESRAKYLCLSYTALYTDAANPHTPSPHHYQQLVASWEKEVAAAVKDHNLDARLIRLCDLIGTPPLPFSFTQSLALVTLLGKGEIVLLGDQSQTITPLYADDAAALIVQALFSRAGKQKIFTATGTVAIPLINLALQLQALQQQAGHATRVVSRKSTPLPPYATPGTLLTPTSPTNLTTSLQAIIDSVPQLSTTPLAPTSTPPHLTNTYAPTALFVTSKEEPLSPSTSTRPHPQPPRVVRPPNPLLTVRKPPRHPSPFWVKSLWFGGGFLAISLAVCAGILGTPLYLLWRAASSSSTPSSPIAVKKNFQKTQEWELLAGSLAQITQPVLAAIPGLNHTYTTLLETLALKSRLSLRQQEVRFLALQSLARFLGTEAGDPYANLAAIGADLDNIYTDISLHQGQLQKGNHLMASLDSRLKVFNQTTTALKTEVLPARQLVSIIPRLVDPNRKIVLLVLLQNSLELRPTGGFLGAFALVTIDHGRLLDTEIKDVYEADSTLQGRVDPPVEIQQYLGEGNWYLRDVNWDPHFPTTAKNAAWFIQKELGREVDGVIGLNLYTLKPLLAAIGPITLSTGQNVSADNLENTAEYFQDVDFNHKNSGKQELLSQIFLGLMTQLKTTSPPKQINFLSALLTSMQSGQVQLYSPVKTVQDALSAANLSGELITPTCPGSIRSQMCVTDSLAVSEANVGINKANYTITREHLHTVNLSGKVITHTHQLILHNTAQSTTWPSGTYKTYLRFYAPANSQLVRVLVGESQLSANDVVVSSEHGKTVIGFYTETPISSTKTITVSYQLETGFPADQSAYTFLFQKQPGTAADPFIFKVNYPSTLLPITVSHPLQPQGSNLEVASKLDKNFFFAVEFTP